MDYKINGHTKLTGLLGSPISHSISPMMHNEAFQQLDLNYVYLCFDVDEKKLPDAVKSLKTLNIRGFNCTMPNKTKMCELADQLSPAAQIIGAVNTVLNDKGILTGYNTDGLGYMRALKEHHFDISGKKMTLLGAGGASTAICVQAALDGAKSIRIFTRRSGSFSATQKLVDTIHKHTTCKAELYDLEDDAALKQSLQDSDLLTNGTSVGMSPNENACIIKSSDLLPPQLIVSDVIYNPRETKLMKLATQAGCTTFNGLYMLLFQGAEAFKIWTGMEMPVELIREKYFK